MKAQKLEALKRSMLEDIHLTESDLGQSATQLVFGYGDPQAQLVMIGEAPGKDEDLQGRPFVGRAGQLLKQLLALIQLKIEDIWLTNLVKYRPPSNRDPSDSEKNDHAPYLEKELDIIKPKLILTLGRHAGAYFKPDLKLSQEHGQAYKLKRFKTSSEVDSKILFAPLYHPAAGLYNPQLVSIMQTDFLKLKPLII
ncbi:MAG: uracil-DNA glycosylase [Candidatus Saccharibacteria bacterium]|nr:uracil-DNA glycosylase [Candidatus Saccharibacteria bacterium]MCY4010881.1 uracil-DNA glycosylase [Candidatus Saccharibacteria bacterium]MCY4089010.1 uracil-DNA glycosylase [Candidatus Saccharibacteria bacterium]